MNYASRNSELALKNHIAQSHSDKENLSQLSKALNITKKIKRVEAYDNSHLSGKNAVGAMIVYSEEGFEKNHTENLYRLIKVKLGDDYGMMRHVLERRFSKEAIKNSKKYEKLPDLLVIDGGKGHYDLAKEILETKGLNEMELISIFKGEGRKESLDQIIYKNKKNFIDKNTPPFSLFRELEMKSTSLRNRGT